VAGAKSPAAAAQKLSLIVSSKAVDDTLGLDTLIGEYTECGTNHNKKVFKRTKVPAGVEEQQVFMYYWDGRDGADFSGWWFGDQVGGTQVWSRCETNSVLPPKAGWRIPWDGDVQTDLVIEPKRQVKSGTDVKDGAKAKAEKEDEDANQLSAAAQAEIDDRTQRATDRVVVAEIEATQALENARAMLEGEVTKDNLKVVEGLLQNQLNALTETNKVLSADIMDARKTVPRAVAALSKLTPRVRSVQATLAQEMKNAKQLFAQKQQELEDKQKQKEAEEKLMLAEQRDAKSLEDALPEAMEVVTQAEELLDTVVAAASPLKSDLAEEVNDFTSSAIKETEAAVVKAQTGIKMAKVHISQKIAAAKQYAPEARKVALAEFTSLQEKLNEIQKSVAAYMRVRKDFEQKLEGKKVIAEVSKKVGDAELEVEKVVSVLKGTKPSTDEIAAAEASIAPAMASAVAAVKLVEERLQPAQCALKTELGLMLDRSKETKKKLEDFKVQLRSQMEGLQAEAILKEAGVLTQAAEDAFLKTTEAEGPFLKGVENVPVEESEAAIAACKSTASVAEAAVAKTRSFFKAKQVVVKCFPEVVRVQAAEDLSQLQARLEEIGQKLAKFTKETSLREARLRLREVTLKVQDAEAKLQSTCEASAPLREGASPKPEDLEVSRLRAATEQTLEAEKAAAVACVDARKILMTKMKEGKAVELPSYQAEVQRLQSKLNAMSQEISRQRKYAIQGEKLWRAKQVVQETEESMPAFEAEVEKAEILTTPLGDERPSDDHVRTMDAAVNAVQAKVTEIVNALEGAKPNVTGSAKDSLMSLLDRARVAQGKVDEMKETTREQRERLMCDTILSQAREKLDAVDELFKKAAEAEVPYLKGIETLPLDESVKAIADCEAAAEAVTRGINEARAFMVEQDNEMKKFLEVVAKSGGKELQELAKKGAQASERLTSFIKDTESRKRTMHQQQAAAKVDEAEEAVKKMADAAANISAKEGSSDEIAAEVAHELCEKFGEAERQAQEKVDLAKRFLAERQRESRKDKKAQGDTQDLSKLVSRINALQVESAKAKAIASEHEQKFVAKMLLHEAGNAMKSLEADIEKVSEESAPLTVEGGKRFIVASMTRMTVEALKDHISKNSMSYDDLFATVGPGAAGGKVPEAEFVAFLEKVPELLSRADLAFSAEQRAAMFQQIDTDGDGMLSKDDFIELFHDRYVCVNGISLTDGFDIGTSKTLDKLEVDDVVQTLGEMKTHETLGVMRVEVRALKDGTRGWVTMQGNQGKVFLSLYTAYASFIKSLDKVMTNARASSTKVNEYLASKIKELGSCEKGPLAEARSQLQNMRPQVGTLQAKLETMKKRIEEGKREHSKREELERKKMEDKKERKAASLILKTILEKVESAEEGLKKLEEVAAPLLGAGDITSVADPIAVREASVVAASAIQPSFADAKTCLQNHEVKVGKAVKGPWFEARQDMKKLKQRVLAAEKRCTEITQGTQEACETLAEAKIGQVASAIRASLQSRGVSTEDLLSEIASGKESISVQDFGKYLDRLEGLSLTPAHRRLVFKDTSEAGFTRRAFFEMIERYYKCVKEIAITSEFEIKSSVSVRKLEAGEVVEVVEGPRSDEGLGVMRIRAKALSDGTIGWVTATGNHGTPFLVETRKPCLHVAKGQVPLQDDFASEGSKEIRSIAAHEVLEILEGPRKEPLGNAMRARCKAVSDGATGWFTMKSQHGTDCVRLGSTTYVCTSSIALTDSIDIKDCKVVRKLSKGEGLTVLEGPIEDEKTNVPRIRARASSDGAEGWVTVRGNAGSVYAEESGRQVIVSRAMPLQRGMDSHASATVRMLAEEEILDILEGPVEEIADPPLRARVRAAVDGKVGWITLRRGVTSPWSPQYKCVAATAMQDVVAPDGATSVGKLEPGDEVELLEGPRLEATFGVLRIKARAAKDGVVGWVTIAGNQGTPFLQVVPPE